MFGRGFTLAGIGALIVSLLILAAYGVYRFSVPAANADIGETLATCVIREDSATVRADAECLRATVSKLLDRSSTEDVLATLEASTTPENVIKRCHVIGHVIGEQTYRRANSLEDALDQCTISCRYACTHGVIGQAVTDEMGEGNADDIAHSDVETLKTLGKKYCEHSAMCHAMGHIAFTNFNTFEGALSLCSDISAKGNREYCFQGVFMESLGADESLLLGPATTSVVESYTYPCDRVAAPYAHACFRYLTNFQNVLFDEREITSMPKRLSIARETCEKLSGHTRSYCFEGIGFNYWRYFAKTPDVGSYCANLRTEIDKDSCLLGLISANVDFFQYDDALKYCERVENPKRQVLCFRVAFQVMEEKLTIGEIEKKCEHMTFSVACRNAVAAYETVKNVLPVYEFGLSGETP